ncbi:hypothetical protein BT93_H3277 [Corymbia citriodora subsp. variegata]|nr:hypothetical protein BT93_H3277 [Corymbia citriodora subsp. variegata]
MDGRTGGSSLIGKKMKTWLGSGTTHLVNGMETLMTKVSKRAKTTGSMPYQRNSLNSATKTRPSSSNSPSSTSRSLTVVVAT